MHERDQYGNMWVGKTAIDVAQPASSKNETDPENPPPPPSRAEEWAWLGLDSRHGRLLAGDGALTSGAIAFGEVREIAVRVARPFRGRYLWVHAPCASSFLIHAVRVGLTATGVASFPIPADIFAVRYDELPEASLAIVPGEVNAIHINVNRSPADLPAPGDGWRGIPFDLPAAFVGMDVSIIVENIERTVYQPARFLGAFLGLTVR